MKSNNSPERQDKETLSQLKKELSLQTGIFVQELRHEMNITQENLAHILSISERHVQKIEAGRTTMSYHIYFLLRNYLGKQKFNEHQEKLDHLCMKFLSRYKDH